MRIPDLGRPILGGANEMAGARVKINSSDCAFVPFINLNHLVGPQVIQFDFAIVGARCGDVAQRMELHLMNHPRVLLVLLQHFLGLHIPNVHKPVIAGNQAFRNGGKFNTAYPVLMLFVLGLQSSVVG